MPTEGFEGEILKLRKMEERKNLKGVVAGKRRKFQKVSRSERIEKTREFSELLWCWEKCGGTLDC